MTALIFSEWLQKQDEEATTITISRKDRRRGSGNNLQPAETLTARDLMANLLLASSNTAAQAIARVVGDDIGAGETSFVKEMNRRAQSFGMLSTNFENAHGLHHADMVTTAADVALLASKAGEDRLVSSLWGKPRHWIKTIAVPARTFRIQTTVKLARRPDLLGGKTGTSRGAGFNLAAQTSGKGNTNIAVVLGAQSDRQRFKIAGYLLDRAM